MIDRPHDVAMRTPGQGIDHAQGDCGCDHAAGPLTPPTNRTPNAAGTMSRAQAKLLNGPLAYGVPAPLNRYDVPLFAVGTVEAAGGGPTGRGGGAAGRLDIEALKGTSQEDHEVHQRILVTGCRCRSWCCPHCCMSYWARLRESVMPHLHLFRKARLLTLTIDRSRFADGEEAHRYIEDHGLIRRLLRLFKFKKAIKVLSFHPRAPDWPHWHILIDIADCGRWVDVKRFWKLWRNEWGIGGCDIQLGRKFPSAQAAARYAFGYVQHQHATIPGWVKTSTRAPRAFETYGKLRATIREEKRIKQEQAAEDHASIEDAIEAGEVVESVDECEDIERDDQPQRSQHRSTTTVAERLSRCDRKSALIVETRYGDGEPRYRFIKQIDLSPGQIALASKLGLIGYINTSSREAGATTVLDVSLDLHGRNIDEAIEDFERECNKCVQDDGFIPAMQWADGAWLDFVGDGVAPF